MKSLLAATTALLAVSNVWGHSLETAIVAAMKLSEVPNYSWTCTVTDDAKTYTIEGKTQNGGYTWQRQPMPKMIARRLGRDAGQDLESIFSSKLRYVIDTGSGWKTLNELPKLHSDWGDEDWYFVTLPLGQTADMAADGSDSFELPPAIYLPVVPKDDADKNRVYSNAQFALALPHEELGVIVSSHADFQVKDGVVSGTLTDLGAQLLLVHDGHEYIKPVTAGGRFKLWLKGGLVEKYLVELAGIMVIDRKPVYVRQKSITMVKDIGTTRLEVPADARRRLLSESVAATTSGGRGKARVRD